MRKLLPILGLITIILFVTSCEPREEAKEPTADFTFSPTGDIKVGEVVTFTNTSLDYTDVLWDFGDGSNTSEVPNPTHIYDEARTYNVTLIVENKGKKAQTTRSLTVIPSVEACFTVSPNPAQTGETLIFTNCSEGADSYEWDINGDGTIDDYVEIPEGWYFNNPGTYTVELTAWSGDASDVATAQLVIEEGGSGNIDPYTYDLGSIWFEHYVNVFDEDNGDFLTGSDSEWSAEISDSEYTITNFGSDTYRLFWTNVIGIPSEDESYDLEILYKLNYDDVTQGQGICWALDNDAWEYNYYRWSTLSSAGYYTIGDNQDGSWLPDPGWIEGGDVGEYNLLTVRKYLDNYYFFMNGEFVFEKPFDSYYGEKFGFFVGASSEMSTAFISIYTMNTGSKSTKAIAKTYKQYTPENIKHRSGGVMKLDKINSLK